MAPKPDSGLNWPYVATYRWWGNHSRLNTCNRISEALGMELVVDFRVAESA